MGKRKRDSVSVSEPANSSPSTTPSSKSSKSSRRHRDHKGKGKEVDRGTNVNTSSASEVNVIWELEDGSKRWEKKLKTSKSLEEVEARHVKQLGCPGVRLTTIREGGREVEILDDYDFKAVKERALGNASTIVVKIHRGSIPPVPPPPTPQTSSKAPIAPVASGSASTVRTHDSTHTSAHNAAEKESKPKKDKGKVKQESNAPFTSTQSPFFTEETRHKKKRSKSDSIITNPPVHVPLPLTATLSITPSSTKAKLKKVSIASPPEPSTPTAANRTPSKGTAAPKSIIKTPSTPIAAPIAGPSNPSSKPKKEKKNRKKAEIALPPVVATYDNLSTPSYPVLEPAQVSTPNHFTSTTASSSSKPSSPATTTHIPAKEQPRKKKRKRVHLSDGVQPVPSPRHHNPATASPNAYSDVKLLKAQTPSANPTVAKIKDEQYKPSKPSPLGVAEDIAMVDSPVMSIGGSTTKTKKRNRRYLKDDTNLAESSTTAMSTNYRPSEAVLHHNVETISTPSKVSTATAPTDKALISLSSSTPAKIDSNESTLREPPKLVTAPATAPVTDTGTKRMSIASAWNLENRPSEPSGIRGYSSSSISLPPGSEKRRKNRQKMVEKTESNVGQEPVERAAEAALTEEHSTMTAYLKAAQEPVLSNAETANTEEQSAERVTSNTGQEGATPATATTQQPTTKKVAPNSRRPPVEIITNAFPAEKVSTKNGYPKANGDSEPLAAANQATEETYPTTSSPFTAPSSLSGPVSLKESPQSEKATSKRAPRKRRTSTTNTAKEIMAKFRAKQAAQAELEAGSYSGYQAVQNPAMEVTEETLAYGHKADTAASSRAVVSEAQHSDHKEDFETPVKTVAATEQPAVSLSAESAFPNPNLNALSDTGKDAEPQVTPAFEDSSHQSMNVKVPQHPTINGSSDRRSSSLDVSIPESSIADPALEDAPDVEETPTATIQPLFSKPGMYSKPTSTSKKSARGSNVVDGGDAFKEIMNPAQQAVLDSRSVCKVCFGTNNHIQKNCPKVKAGLETLQELLEERRVVLDGKKADLEVQRKKAGRKKKNQDDGMVELLEEGIDFIKQWIERQTIVRKRVMGETETGNDQVNKTTAGKAVEEAVQPSTKSVNAASVESASSLPVTNADEAQQKQPLSAASEVSGTSLHHLRQKALAKPRRPGSLSGVSASDAMIETVASESESSGSEGSDNEEKDHQGVVDSVDGDARKEMDVDESSDSDSSETSSVLSSSSRETGASSVPSGDPEASFRHFLNKPLSAREKKQARVSAASMASPLTEDAVGSELDASDNGDGSDEEEDVPQRGGGGEDSSIGDFIDEEGEEAVSIAGQNDIQPELKSQPPALVKETIEAVDEKEDAASDQSRPSTRSFMALDEQAGPSPAVDEFEGSRALREAIDEEEMPEVEKFVDETMADDEMDKEKVDRPRHVISQGLPSPPSSHGAEEAVAMQLAETQEQALKSTNRRGRKLSKLSLAPSAPIDVEAVEESSADLDGVSSSQVELEESLEDSGKHSKNTRAKSITPRVATTRITRSQTSQEPVSPQTRSRASASVTNSPEASRRGSRGITKERDSTPPAAPKKTGDGLQLSGVAKSAVQSSPRRTRSQARSSQADEGASPLSTLPLIPALAPSPMSDGESNASATRRSTRARPSPLFLSQGSQNLATQRYPTVDSSLPVETQSALGRTDGSRSDVRPTSPIPEESEDAIDNDEGEQDALESRSSSVSTNHTSSFAIPRYAPPPPPRRASSQKPTQPLLTLSSLEPSLLRAGRSAGHLHPGTSSQPPTQKRLMLRGESEDVDDDDDESSSEEEDVPADRKGRYASGKRQTSKVKTNGVMRGW